MQKTIKSSNINSDRYIQSKNIYQKYWKNVSNELVNMQYFIVKSDNCEYCKVGEPRPSR
jgi:thymidylate kinase